MSAQKAGSGQGGFTLLEVLIAVVVLGMLVVGLSQGVRTGLAMRQAQVKRLGETAELDAAMRLLRTVLTRIPVLPEARRPVAAEARPRFRGEADHVGFVGDLPTGLGISRRAELMLHVRDGRLILSWSPYRHERALVPPPPATDTELLQGVARLDLAYWNPPAGDQPAGWKSSWEELSTPGLIRVRLVFGENDRRRWPDLITAPSP